MVDEDLLFWSSDDLGRGIESLISATGQAVRGGGLPPVPRAWDDVRLWLIDAPRTLGLEGSVRDIEKADLLPRLLQPGVYAVPLPSLVRRARYALVISSGASCRVMQRDGTELPCSTVEVADVLGAAMNEPNAQLSAIFAGLPGGERALARMLEGKRLDDLRTPLVTFRPDAASPLTTIARHDGAVRQATLFVCATLATLTIASIAAFTLGKGAIDGVVDRSRVLAWIMVSLVGAPFAYLSTRQLSLLSLTVGRAIKRRSLEGAFFLSEDTLRREGFNNQLARINEASLLERVSVSDLFTLLTAMLLTSVALYLFSRLERQALIFILLAVIAIGAAGVLAARIIQLHTAAYRQRSVLTGDVVEKLIGHRTRAVQENPRVWHTSEDRRLAAYAIALRRLDRASTAMSLLSRVWILVAGSFVALEYVLHPTSSDVADAALAIFLLSLALTGLASAVERAGGVVTALRSVGELFEAGRQRGRPQRALHTVEEQDEWPMVLATSSLAFSYRPGTKPIFSEASIRVRRGERVLVEGPSGGGKTTFAKIVAGELRPRGGSILVCGVDPFTGSEAQWRRLVASVPQFHENHVFAQTFAFNVDPGRGREFLSDEAREICNELELGPVLAKMPAGSAQLMGETGWQLSHGERSRLFIARALLQKAQLVILDESFAALDPVTMKTVVECVRRRSSTLLVIAHV